MWKVLPLKSVVTEQRESVNPAALGDQLVDHYSIPALDLAGKPEVVPAREIQSSKQSLKGGEVIVSRLNPRKARVHNVPDLHERIALASGEFIVMLPRHIEARFLKYYLLAESTRQYLDSRVQSVTRSHQRIRSEILMKLPISTPDLPQQQAIADYLDSETARIDALISKKRCLIELLEERDQRILDDLFGNAIRGGFTRLGYVAEVRSGVTLGGIRPKAKSETVVPYLRVANVQHGRLDLSEVKTITVDRVTSQRTRLRSGDVLMTEGGDIDKLGRGTVWRNEIDPCLHQNHVFAVRLQTRDLLPEFLALVTRTSRARCYFEMTGVRSTNLASTNASKVSDFRIPYPSLDVQLALVRSYQRKWDSLDKARTALNRQLDLLAERRKSLITAAVTGPVPTQ